MKILFISSQLPHAGSISGHQIVYQRIKRLSERGHEIGLAALADDHAEKHIPEIRTWVKELELQPWPKKPIFPVRLFRYFFSPVPSRFRPSYSPALARSVGDMVERTHYDVVVAEYGLMGQYLTRNPFLPAVRKVISIHHCHTLTVQQALDTLGFSPRALEMRVGLRKLRRYEFNTYRAADQVLVLTPEERYGVLSHASDLRVTVIPSGVDTDFYQPGEEAEKEDALVFTGYYSDDPNRDAVLWFVNTVWPRLKKIRPNLVFYVIGPDPPHAIRELARKDPNIIVPGWVKDIRPYLRKARVFVCPTRLGSGMRGKVLQAMACGLPVVSTSLGAEGIPFQVGNNGFLADKPRIMAQYIDLLLGDQALRESIAKRARDLVVDRFSWDRGIQALENILKEVVSG